MKKATKIKRRDFIQKSLVGTGAIMAASSLPLFSIGSSKLSLADINLGAISYSFRSMPDGAEEVLGYLTQVGLGAVELMGGAIESYAGAPKGPARKRGQLTDAEKAERKKFAEDLKAWRIKAPIGKFNKLRKMYDKEGVKIEVVKFPLDRMSVEEADYCFRVARVLGAKGITLERSDEVVKQLAPLADKHKMMIGYHNHAKVNFNSWDAAVGYSNYNALNLDVGHYIAGTNESPIPLLKKYADKTLSIHLKDRKKNNGKNMPWGEGDTPLREILQLMKKENYQFMATIELEYAIPEGSDAVKEVGKCVEFCKDALR